ncbi:Holliday junction branch migration protein RuvA, partial [bacterium]|nr:Holliday junction branch migration protein RuvA [bacterium]
MIQFLSGILSEATEENIVVECGGVGYEVSVPTTVIANLPSIGDSIKIFTHHYIREDSQSLYGFLRTQDRLLFGTLISVSGVGPKVGIRFFSAMHADQLVNAIVAEDVRLLTSVPGVGKKLAERVIIELKDKLPKLYHLELSTATKLPGKPL